MNSNITLTEARKRAAYWSRIAADRSTERSADFTREITEQVSYYRSLILCKTVKRKAHTV